MSLFQLHFRLKDTAEEDPWQISILFCGRWNKLWETNFFSYVRYVISWSKNTFPAVQNMLLLMGSLLPCCLWDLPSFLNYIGTFKPSLMADSFWICLSMVAWSQYCRCLMSRSCKCLRVIKARTPSSPLWSFVLLEPGRTKAGKTGVLAAHMLWFMQCLCAYFIVM